MFQIFGNLDIHWILPIFYHKIPQEVRTAGYGSVSTSRRLQLWSGTARPVSRLLLKKIQLDVVWVGSRCWITTSFNNREILSLGEKSLDAANHQKLSSILTDNTKNIQFLLSNNEEYEKVFVLHIKTEMIPFTFFPQRWGVFATR